MKNAINLYRDKSPEENGDFYTVDDVVAANSRKKYEVQERLAAGGNGVVHECQDVASGEALAIKFQIDFRDDRRRRFGRECELGLAVSHQHLLRVHDLGEVTGNLYIPDRRSGHGQQRWHKQDQLPFLVMERAETTLYQEVKRGKRWAPEVYIGQFRGLAAALGNLHEFGLHRDIKPQNILIVGDRWVLGDYGLCCFHNAPARDQFTPNWEVIGPRFWMSPEANNRAVGMQDTICKQSDVFQLASVFWYVVTRRHPTGILRESDWNGPAKLLPPLMNALHHDRTVRPTDGTQFAQAIAEAVTE